VKIASIKFFLISYFLILLSPNALAEGEEKFSVKAEVDKASLTIGERVEYRVTITHDPSIQVLSKVVPAPSDAFEVKEAHDFYEKHGKEIAEGRRFVLTLYDLGEFISILQKVTVDSIYYHVFEARIRLEKGTNDFSAWFENSLGEKELAKQVAKLDPYTHTMEGLREKIIRLVESRLVKENSAKEGSS